MFLLSASPHEDEQPDSVLLASLLITLVRGDSRVRTVGCEQQIEEMEEAAAAAAAQLASGGKGWHSCLKRGCKASLLYSKSCEMCLGL